MIHFVIGTRAQLFKMTPVMLECEKRGLEWRMTLALTHSKKIFANYAGERKTAPTHDNKPKGSR